MGGHETFSNSALSNSCSIQLTVKRRTPPPCLGCIYLVYLWTSVRQDSLVKLHESERHNHTAIRRNEQALTCSPWNALKRYAASQGESSARLTN